MKLIVLLFNIFLYISSTAYQQPDTRYQGYSQDYSASAYGTAPDYSQASVDYTQPSTAYDSRSYGYGK